MLQEEACEAFPMFGLSFELRPIRVVSGAETGEKAWQAHAKHAYLK